MFTNKPLWLLCNRLMKTKNACHNASYTAFMRILMARNENCYPNIVNQVLVSTGYHESS